MNMSVQGIFNTLREIWKPGLICIRFWYSYCTCSEGSSQIITLSFMHPQDLVCAQMHTNILVKTCTRSHMPALTHTLFERRLCVAILPGPCLHAKFCHGASLHSNPSAKDVNPPSREQAWLEGVSEGAATEGEKESRGKPECLINFICMVDSFCKALF